MRLLRWKAPTAAAVGTLWVSFLCPAAAGATQAHAIEAQAAGRAGAPSFDPFSVTFVSLTTGWALGSMPCSGAGACLALKETSDAGRSWRSVHLPAAMLSQVDRRAFGGTPALLDRDFLPAMNVRFADMRDGWIYGSVPSSGGGGGVEGLVWSTHDGGQTWRQLRPVAMAGVVFPLFDLEAMGRTAYLMAVNSKAGVTVASSPVGKDAWVVDKAPTLMLPAGGSNATGNFVFQGGRGWLVEGNDRGTTGSAELAGEGKWGPWAAPCVGVGDSYTVPAAATAGDMVALCVMGGFAFPLSKSAPKGATLGSTWLYTSANAGASFAAGPELSKSLGSPFWGSVLASPAPGTVLAGRSAGNTADLAASFDGGRHWGPEYNGEFFYLGFTSPSQGAGLFLTGGAESSPATAMIMTFDGGRRWAKVKF